MKKIVLMVVATMFVYSNFPRQPYKYYSQFAQDKYVNERIFKGKKNGVFFDIGAYDGKTDSNSYFFEKNLHWTGVCVEPVTFLFKRMSRIRKCALLNGCIWNKTGKAKFLKATFGDGRPHGYSGLVDTYDERHLAELKEMWVKKYGCIVQTIEVDCYEFNDICHKAGIKRIDYLSIDTEGSELDILKSIDFSKIYIDVIGVENNFEEPFIRDFLRTQGYLFLHRIGVDDFYRKSF